jgi:hypothetical protein
MKKELKIKVHLDYKFEIDAQPNLDDWNDATYESKDYYVRERVKEFLINQLDDIIEDLINDSKIEF